MPRPGMQGERGRHGGRVWESELQFRPELLADGLTDKHLRRMRRSGEMATVRRGAYVRADGNGPGEPVDHLLRVRAAVRALSVSAVVSHVSAAALLGLPVWGMSMTRVHVIRARPTGGRREHRLHVHALSLPADEIATVDGLAITTPGRTLVDIGAHAAVRRRGGGDRRRPTPGDRRRGRAGGGGGASPWPTGGRASPPGGGIRGRAERKRR
jgi:hypothetical protein